MRQPVLSPGGWRWLIALLALLLGLAPQLWLGASTPHRVLDRLVTDQATRLRASALPETRVVLVDIDERSLAELGPWPWPRSRMATLVETLVADYQARAVALDLAFPEPGEREGDRRLVALAERTPVVLSHAFDYTARSPALEVGRRAKGSIAGASAAGARAELMGVTPTRASGFVGNFAALRHAPHVGNIGFVPDPDGAIRRLPWLTQHQDALFLPLSVELLLAAGTSVRMPHVGGDGAWALPFHREWSAYSVVPAREVIGRRAPLPLLAGQLVIVGSSSFGLGDRVATPLDRSSAGAMVHAAAASALLDGIGGRWSNWLAPLAVLLCIVGTVAFGIRVLPRLSALTGVSALLAIALAWLVLCLWVLAPYAPYAPSGPLGTLMVLAFVAVPNEWRLAQRESSRLIRTFEHYVARPVLDELLSRPEHDALQPRLLQVTTLVADMEGYSALVERASLDEAVSLTREFLDCVTRPVLRHDGTLDKYNGDGLMAFWGAPLASVDHADRAIDAARDMLVEVAKFNEVRQAKGKPAVRVRVGIETGLAMAGDLGTPFRSVFTAVGDSVNMASRLQELARAMPFDIVIGPGAAKSVQRQRLQPLGHMRIRGRQNSLEVFTVGPSA